jgi:hypothetical protein
MLAEHRAAERQQRLLDLVRTRWSVSRLLRHRSYDELFQDLGNIRASPARPHERRVIGRLLAIRPAAGQLE